MVCGGCQNGLPKLDHRGVQASCYEGYKLRRLPGSPLGGLDWMEELATEIVSSLKDCLWQKGGKPLQGIEEPGPADIQPPKSKTSRRGRRDTSAERNLT